MTASKKVAGISGRRSKAGKAADETDFEKRQMQRRHEAATVKKEASAARRAMRNAKLEQSLRDKETRRRIREAKGGSGIAIMVFDEGPVREISLYDRIFRRNRTAEELNRGRSQGRAKSGKKSREGGGTIEVTLPSSGRRVTVPVGPDGYVPPEAMARFLDAMGDKASNDWDRRADFVLPQRITPRQAAPWFADTDGYDIEGIDVRGPALRNTGARRGEAKRVHDRIVVHSLPGQEALVRDLVDEAIPSVAERRKLVGRGEIEIEVRPMDGRTLGSHSGSTIALRRDRGGLKNETIVHELVHHLRQVDGDRRGITRSAIPADASGLTRSQRRNLINLEESCTVAEQLARAREAGTSGYYLYAQVRDRKTGRWRNPTVAEAVRMSKEDRKLFTGPGGKPLSGRAAVASVEEHWKDSHIARMKMGGQTALRTAGGMQEEKDAPAKGRKTLRR